MLAIWYSASLVRDGLVKGVVTDRMGANSLVLQTMAELHATVVLLSDDADPDRLASFAHDSCGYLRNLT